MIENLIGQDGALGQITPFLEIHASGLGPSGRPGGIFFLYGPTGCGKTHTVERLAKSLHGFQKSFLRVDCGEFQMEHEVAKLIGAPPGYLGHGEARALLSQEKLNAITSDLSPLSLILFDEIEKGAGSLKRLLLGVMDRALLRLGDNTMVNFENSLIFFTSNLRDLGEIGRVFSPEFRNRLDALVEYKPLGPEALKEILEIRLGELQVHIRARLGARAFSLRFSDTAKRVLLRLGTSEEFGAREMKRVLHREVILKLARGINQELIPPGGVVRFVGGKVGLGMEIEKGMGNV